jgi:pimeloyl-ACP methyl ester carboxylesterase
MAMKRMDVEFTKDGHVLAPLQVDALLSGLQDVTDLIVVSHGWNNDMAEARALYDELLGNIDRLLAARDKPTAPAPLAQLAGRTFAACQVFWPSKKFADEDLIPGGGAASATAANDAALLRTLDGLARDPTRLGDTATSPVREQIVARAKSLVSKLDGDEAARHEFVFLLRSLLNPDQASGDDGSDDFFTVEPRVLFENMDTDVIAPRPAGAGGATTLGNAGGAASLGDLLKGAKAAARRLANFATYYQMKTRAGTIGSTGLSPMLRRIRERHPNLKVHLVGHSFGGRLVTAAAQALDSNTPAVTVSLLQAAFSHNGLSEDFDAGQPGVYRQVVSDRRASGPIVITHTKNDTAVGIAYPLASRIARQNASAFGDANDPYGGMGRNGAQRTAEATGNATTLAAVGHDYGFASGRIYNLLADDIIKNHGDVRGVQVAFAVLSAARAV